MDRSGAWGPHRRRFNAHDKRTVGARQNWKCKICGEYLEAAFHVDHVVPLWKGGEDVLENAQALCVRDHAEKTQLEEVERLRRLSERGRRPATLQCSNCFRVVSPYFIHKCF